MSYRLPRYRVALVREGSCLSEQKTIRSPDDVCSLMGWRGQPRGGSNPATAPIVKSRLSGQPGGLFNLFPLLAGNWQDEGEDDTIVVMVLREGGL